jgi:hypothetical protein
MECELSFNGQVVCSDGRRFVWRQGSWVQVWPPTGAAAADTTQGQIAEPERTKKSGTK